MSSLERLHMDSGQNSKIKNLVVSLAADWSEYEDEMWTIHEHSGSWEGFVNHSRVREKLKLIDDLVVDIRISEAAYIRFNSSEFDYQARIKQLDILKNKSVSDNKSYNRESSNE